MSNWQPLGEVAREYVTDARRRLDNEEKAENQQGLEWLTVEERAIFYGELKGYAAGKGWKPGWPAVQYKKRFGYFPEASVAATPVLACGLETRLWVKATMQDAWKRKKRKP